MPETRKVGEYMVAEKSVVTRSVWNICRTSGVFREQIGVVVIYDGRPTFQLFPGLSLESSDLRDLTAFLDELNEEEEK